MIPKTVYQHQKCKIFANGFLIYIFNGSVTEKVNHIPRHGNKFYHHYQEVQCLDFMYLSPIKVQFAIKRIHKVVV